VQAHPHANLATLGPLVRPERTLGRDRTRDRVSRARERVEERVALGVDLRAALVTEAFPEQPPVVAHDLAVGIAQLLEQPRRALDVGEEKCDGASGKRCHGA
jgi:hypothetical protein